LAKRILESGGYQVFESQSAESALQFLKTYNGSVDLLPTDLVLTGMAGRKLAEQVRALRSNVWVLYMSGYTGEAVVRHGELESGIAFLEKPFAAGALLRKVRELLDTEVRISVQ
jgi:DNA-binding response OmpR family regulator